jgi:hypothetical protein
VKNDKIVRTVEKGVYEVQDGSFVLVASLGKRQRKKRMPAGTSEKKLRFTMAEMRAELGRDRIRVAKNTLAEDVDRYLIAIRGEVQFISDREREIRSWLPRFGQRRRDSIEPGEIKDQLREWRSGYAAHLQSSADRTEPSLCRSGRSECIQPRAGGAAIQGACTDAEMA